MDITVTVCDVCADRTREATKYLVKSLADGREGETARCDEHGWELLGVSRGNPAPKSPRSTGRGRRAGVSTMADVEAAKKAAAAKKR